MTKSWNTKGMRKWTMKEALGLNYLQIAKMKLPERAELAAFFQSQLKQRVASYNRAKKYNHPYAYEKLRNDFEELNNISGYEFDFFSPVIQSHGRKHALGQEYAKLDNPNAKLMSYIAQMQDFFESKSSTVSGWRDIIRNESMKLFGYKEYKTKRGSRIVLNHLMTEDERKMFWTLYNELSKFGAIAIYDSEQMRETGYTRIWREKVANNEWDFDDLTSMMKEMVSSLKANGVFVRDFAEHIPGNMSDPTQPDPDGDVDSNVFEW